MKNLRLLISTLVLFFISCNINTSGQYTYQQPEQINDGLEVGNLKEVNIDSRYIEDAVCRIAQGKYRAVHSMLIYKADKLVFEEYFPGYKYKWDGPGHLGEWANWDKSMPHHIMSATKSITSACIGIAIEKGCIESIHQSIFDYLHEYQHLATDGKDKITIEHLLAMTSGLEWDEWSAPLGSAANDLVGLWVHCTDPVTCILERPLINEPGTSFTYSGGNMVLLGEIIKNSSQINIDEFSKKYLFEPLGIESSEWEQRFENGVIYAGGGVKITSRDMVKIGVTYLNNGQWNGDQIISKNWVDKSATSFPGNHGINIPGQASGKHGYSYSWWLKSYTKSGKKIEMFNAGGWGGQEIMVIPDLDAVIVFTGGCYLSNVKVFKILEKYILPSIG